MRELCSNFSRICGFLVHLQISAFSCRSNAFLIFCDILCVNVEQCMNRLRLLDRWDHGFESHSRHGDLCTFVLCLCYSVCR
jgi:hypothetical protein